MKLISLVSFLASLSTAVALPVRLETAGCFLFAAALVLLMVQDYSTRRTLRFETTVPAAADFSSRFFFHRRAARSRPAFRAPALASETHGLAA